MMIRKFYSAQSDISIQESCEKIQLFLQLPSFTFDAEDTWEYARCSTDSYSLNITKTDDFDTIHSWMKKAPNNVNYQIILNMDQFESEELCQEIEKTMSQIFGKSFALYDEE